MHVPHPTAIQTTHYPSTSGTVGAFYFLGCRSRDQHFDDPTIRWWVSYAGDWVNQEGFDTIEDAMTAAAMFSRSKKLNK